MEVRKADQGGGHAGVGHPATEGSRVGVFDHKLLLINFVFYKVTRALTTFANLTDISEAFGHLGRLESVNELYFNELIVSL